MNLPVFNQKAKKIEEIEVNDSVFNAPVNDKVLAQYVYVYLSNQRESNAHTKDRSEVRGGGKKPWKQKGTGRARVGSIRSPIWKGGGVTFGPTNQTNWKRKLTKSFKAAAFRNAFSKLNKAGLLNIIDGFEIKEPSTKEAV
ncbi:partial 50S ribosomal protein L4, partial [uncultured bacterium]